MGLELNPTPTIAEIKGLRHRAFVIVLVAASGTISRLCIFCASDKMTVRFDQGLGRSAQ